MKHTAAFHTRRVLTSSSISVSSHLISHELACLFFTAGFSFAERALGGLDVFLPYVKDYVDTFIGKSITTAQWKAHLYSYWEKHGGAEKIKVLDDVKWDAWFYGEGVELPVKMDYDLTLAKTAYNLAERWDAARETDIPNLDFNESDLKDFNSNQIGLCFSFKEFTHTNTHPHTSVVFLEKLESYPPLPSDLTLYLGTIYNLSTTPNAEIRLRFYRVALSDPSSSAAKTLAVDAARWVIGDDGSGVVKGRMKFCRPVLRAVANVERDLAISNWEKAKTEFHPIARKLIEKVNMVEEITMLSS